MPYLSAGSNTANQTPGTDLTTQSGQTAYLRTQGPITGGLNWGFATNALGFDAQNAYSLQLGQYVQNNRDDPAGLGFPMPQEWMTHYMTALGSDAISGALVQAQSLAGTPLNAAQQAQLRRDILTRGPAEKAQLIADALGLMDPTQHSAALNRLKSYGFWSPGLLDAGLGIAPTLSPAQQAQLAQDNAARSRYLQMTGHMPSEGQVRQMSGMNEIDFQKFLDAQPYKNGLTFGQWNAAVTRIDKYYQQYFGRKANDEEITWASGKSDDQIQTHIMESPSRVSGLNMGQYTSYKTSLDTVMQNTYGYEAPDSLIKDFHHATTGQSQ